ncbi:50S ribosomal protein L6, partial [Halochromatium sp.]
MSRIGKAPVQVPKGVNVQMTGRDITVKGPKGSLSWSIHPFVEVDIDGAVVTT